MTEFFTTGLIWGCMLILIGLITLINVIFNINIPVFRILLALFFIYLGLKTLTGTSRTDRYFYSSCSSAQGVCTEKNITQYNIMFNKQIIDLTNPDILTPNMLIEINTSFAESIVLIDTTQPMKIEASASFGSMELPNNTQLSFGSHMYQTPTYQSSTEPINMKARVVFGKCIIIDKKNYHGSMNENKDNHEQKN